MTLTTLSVDSKDLQTFVKQKLKHSAAKGEQLSNGQYFHILVEKEETKVDK